MDPQVSDHFEHETLHCSPSFFDLPDVRFFGKQHVPWSSFRLMLEVLQALKQSPMKDQLQIKATCRDNAATISWLM